MKKENRNRKEHKENRPLGPVSRRKGAPGPGGGSACRKPKAGGRLHGERKTEPVDATGRYLIWGINSIGELLERRAVLIDEILLLKDRPNERLQHLATLADQRGVPVRPASAERLDELADASHQGIAAWVKPGKTLTLTELCRQLDVAAEPPLLLALDCLQDPHNLGSIIRSAVAAGVTAILLPKDRTAPVTGTVYKVSAGALASVTLCSVTNLVAALGELKKRGVWIYGTALEAEKTIYQEDWRGPSCLVIGNESKGLRPLVRQECDQLVSIPMRNSFDSLNAAVACAVVLFEMVRQRSG